jgi:hypothetical protein
MPATNPITVARVFQPISGPLLLAALFPGEEVWAPIPDFPGYRMSSFARCAGFLRRKGRGRGHGSVWVQMGSPQRFMKPVYSAATKRFYFKLCSNGKILRHQVGHWMLRAFLGYEPESGLECCHRDGDATNNTLENLRWGTRSSNQFDAVIHRTHHSVKLTPADVNAIRARLASGARKSHLAREFGVSSSVISGIWTGRKWAQLEWPKVD